MDGWGLAPDSPANAISNAYTPNIDRLTRDYPNLRLKSDGPAVGLPPGQFGTSEVNHMAIGTGQIVPQDLTRINNSLDNGEFFHNSEISELLEETEKKNTRLQLIGILSDGGIHSHTNHLEAILGMCAKKNFSQKIYIHIFTDGRDVPPKSALKYIKQLNEKIYELKDKLTIKIASIQGRYYLDRDRDWQKTEEAFKLIVKGSGNIATSAETAVNMGYVQVRTDEFLPQYLIERQGVIRDGDGVLFFHYRSDRMYQLTKRILESELKNLTFASFIRASEEFKDILIAFPRLDLKNTLAEVIAAAGRTQLHVTETEKYSHLTYFFNGEREEELAGETWKLFQSNRLIKPLYNFEPSMRNFDIASEVIEAVEKDSFDFIVANFSSPDMVGHTGNYAAALISAESVDFCIGKIYDAIKDRLDEYTLLITADHGNSEKMWDEENNQPHTQHTLSPVPFIFVGDKKHIAGKSRLVNSDSLASIAPTVTKLMGITTTHFPYPSFI